MEPLRFLRRAAGPAALFFWAAACRTASQAPDPGPAVSHPSPGLSDEELANLRTDLPSIGVEAVRRKQALGEAFALIDVRGYEEWDKDRIQGAVHLPYFELQSRLAEVPRDKPVVVYCGGGTCPLSRWSEQKLMDWGLTNVQHMEGGITAWREHGYPIESGAPR